MNEQKNNDTGPAQPRRKTQLNLVVGINGTGKTTFLRQNIVEQRHKVLVITPDECEWRQLPIVEEARDIFYLNGTARMIYRDAGTLERAIRYYSGGALILDDAMAYLGFQTPETMRYLYIRRRQRGVDVFLVAHGLRQVPPQAFTFGSYLVLFATTENFTSRRRELDAEIYSRIVEAQGEMNAEARQGNPYGYKIIKLDPTL